MKICVFCSSKIVSESTFDQAAVFCQELVRNHFELIYGGSLEGLMGYIANATLERGGKVHGIFPRGLFPNELAHTGLTQLIFVDDLMARKRKMMAMADAFVVFPGGIGTLDEAIEVVTWKSLNQLGDKPVVFFNWEGFWNPFLNMLKEMQVNGMLYPEIMASFRCVHTVEDIFAAIEK